MYETTSGRSGQISMLVLVALVVIPFGMAPHFKSWDGHRFHVIEERDGSDNVARQIVYGGGSPLWQILADASSQYYHEDPRGNVVALTEGAGLPTELAGEVLERYTYDAYHKPTFQDPANQDKRSRTGVFADSSEYQNTLLAGGRWYDAVPGARSASVNTDFGGWYWRGAQYYNPNTGRHMTRFHEGDPDRPLVTGRMNAGRSYPGAYAPGSGAPVNDCLHPLCGGYFAAPVGAPRDAASGLPSGKRQHKPVSLTKRIDKASPLLTGPLVSNDGHSPDDLGRIKVRMHAGYEGDERPVRKKPGRTKYSPLSFGVEEPDFGLVAATDPGSTRGKEKFKRDKIHLIGGGSQDDRDMILRKKPGRTTYTPILFGVEEPDFDFVSSSEGDGGELDLDDFDSRRSLNIGPLP